MYAVEKKTDRAGDTEHDQGGQLHRAATNEKGPFHRMTQIAQMTQVPWPPTHSTPRADRKNRPHARCIPTRGH
jgi:hypothetical protein